ncbi:MAG: hypothetical protein U0R71_15050 [Solirubrobacterales bacterium]
MSWLDSLARRAAGGGRAGDGPRRPADPAAEGTTRRRALQTAAGAAGAVAVFGPGRLLKPAAAAAATTCSQISSEVSYKDFQACVKGPLEDLTETSEAIQDAEEHLRVQKKPAARRRLRRIIEDLTRRRNRALKEVEFCNGVFAQDRAEGEAKCQAAGGGSGTGSGGNGSGCEPGFVLCGPENYCCNTEYASCQGCNGKPICCRIGGDCCPGD